MRLNKKESFSSAEAFLTNFIEFSSDEAFLIKQIWCLIFQVDGLVIANGGNVSQNFGGGGSGGSILINTQVLTGGLTGSIQVQGGTVTTSVNGGGGAGGRIAVYYNNTVKDAFYGGTFDSNGGTAGTHSESGASGTVYLKHTGQNFSKLIVDNKGGWAMDTEIEAAGQRLELYNGFSSTGSSFSRGGNTVVASCSAYYHSRIYYPLSALFDQSYIRPYYRSYYTYSNRYHARCHSGDVRVSFARTMLVNTVRIFPVQGTSFKVSLLRLFA